MTPPRSFELVYAPVVRQHLKVIDRKYYPLIRETIEAQLQFDPDIETRNRKPLKRPAFFEAKWEIRFGPNNRFRVYYQVDYDNNQVIILAIGEKIGSQVVIGGEELEL